VSYYRIRLLGTPSIYSENKEFFLTRRKSVALLAYLADTDRRVLRNDAADIFWPDIDRSHGLAALRSSIADIKNILGAHIFASVKDSIYLSDELFECDVALFRSTSESIGNIESMKAKAALWKGGFLKGFSLKNCIRFSDWQFLEEQNLMMEYRRLLKRVTSELIGVDSLEEAIHFTHECLMLDSYDEETYRELMRLYAWMGNKNSALQQYKLCLNSLESDLGFPVEEETKALAEHIRTGIVGKKSIRNKKVITPSEERLLRIAVLPFILHGKKEKGQPDICDIIEETITDYCANISELEVISRTSMCTYKNSNKTVPRIAAELKVDYIVEGFADDSKGRIVVEGRLIDSIRDTVVSIKKIETSDKLDDMATHAEHIIIELIDKIGILPLPLRIEKDDPGLPWRLQARSLTRDSEAHSMDLAINLYKHALDLNSKDAEAWAGIANALQCKCNIGLLGVDTTDLYKKAEDAANKALSINPYESTALHVKGVVAEERDWDYGTAEKYYMEALNFNPNNPMVYASLSLLFTRLNRMNESRKMAEKAYDIDPVNIWTIFEKLWSYVASGLFRQAQQVLDEFVTIFPHPTWNTYDQALMQILIGNYDIAISKLENVKQDMISENKHTLLGTLAYAYAENGRVGDAEKLVADLSRNRKSFIGFHLPFAAVYTALGKYNKALEWLEKAVETKDPGILALAIFPYYKPLYKLPAYREILNRVHIAPRE
jgi:DNA-binding SARP family transcriptional activator/Tfp pilus assembly protein PilF